MRIIFTQEDRKIARKNIDGFRQSYIIDAREMVLESDYIAQAVITSPQDYIVQQEMEKRLTQAMNNKKSTQVIYFHYQISGNLVKNIKDFFKSNDTSFIYTLYDPNGILTSIHKLFDEVLD